MIRSALILSFLLPLGGAYRAQYLPAGPHFPTATSYNACLISGWPINEGSGQTLQDVSGNSNTAGIFTGSPVWGANTGFPGSSWTVSSNGAHASSTTLTNFTGTTPFSLAAWVNNTTTAADQIFISSLINPGVYTGWELQTGSSTNTIHLYIINTYGTNAIDVHGSTNIQNTGKHYVVATYDGSRTAAGVKLYVDGALETMTTVTNNLTLSIANGQAPGLGVRPADTATMSGVLAAPAIYNCVLNSTDIASYYARGPQVN